MPKFLLCFCIVASSVSVIAQQRSASGKNGVVVSVCEYASSAGLDILKKGGTAVDAAVTTSLVLAVTYPQAGNIGGGGFMLVRTADGKTTGIDYREKAPVAAHAEMFLRRDGTPDSMLANYGYLVAGIPGTLRGLELAWQKHGRLPWKELVRPAVELAERGFIVYPVVAKTMAQEARYLSLFPESKKIFFKAGGLTHATGDVLVQSDLARTLALIADSGAAVFYEGSLAARMVEEIRRNGGIWTMGDLRSYNAVERQVVRGTYRGYEIIGMPPPSSGGLTTIEGLNILENARLKPGDAETLHLMSEAMRRAFYDRMRFQGDMDFVQVPMEKLTSKSYAKELFGSIEAERASVSLQWNEKSVVGKENLETTHFSIVDSFGNAVSCTFTLEDNYGSHAVVKDLGFLLNSEMHDFNVRPHEPNYQGGYGGNPNLIEPGKRMLSSMAPTIVTKDGRLFLITGSPGGRTIINTVIQMIVATVDYGFDLRTAVEFPRISHNWLPDEIRVERGRWPEKTLSSLRKKGHRVVEVDFLGDAHSILWDPDFGEYRGEADDRRHGSAKAF